MKTVFDFIQEIGREIGLPSPQIWQDLNEMEISRRFLRGVNEYFFQTHEGIGTTGFGKDAGNQEELQYFSEFHKYWEANHEKILHAHIDVDQASVAALCFIKAVKKYGKRILGLTLETHGLTPRAIAQVRFFTANQDFREPPQNQFSKYLIDPTRFEARGVLEDPESFLKFFGMTKLSQGDKRLDFARNAGRFLTARGIEAYEIAATLGNDAVRIRESIVGEPNMGYGSKKANMFIRDMVALNVWTGLSNYDQILVASDINTMKVALRARILRTEIPLISSFIDIFCHQYGYIDRMSAQAWRTVWEEWRRIDPESAPASPGELDFVLYRIGREYCKDNVAKYRCENGHEFLYFGGRLEKCRVCQSLGKKSSAHPISWSLPCQVDAGDLPREDGKLLLDDKNLLSLFDGVCIFEDVCRPKTITFQILDPPKSISIRGQTSWTNSMWGCPPR